MTIGDFKVKKMFFAGSNIKVYLGNQQLYPTNLDAPVLSRDGDMLIIYDESGLATSFQLYVDGVASVIIGG